MWSSASRLQSLASATYKKSLRPVALHSASQVSWWVWSSFRMPATLLNWTGTLPSRVVVKMKRSCLRSPRWSFE